MAEECAFEFPRRSFVQASGALAGGLALAGRTASALAAPATKTLPTRVLGKTKENVTVLALGTAPARQSRTVDTPTVKAIVKEALDLGINFIDSARVYGNAEEGIGQLLGPRRKDVFLTTKVWADDAAGARKSLEQSLRLLRTDYVDLVYLHSMGNRNGKRVLEKDGALTYLLKQKEAGKTRFIGVSGHSKVESFVPIIETGHVDVVMVAMNFIDRYTYNFEEKVLPVANKHKLGIACMKVFGGIKGGFRSYGGPNPGPQLSERHLYQAVRYAMELPGVATLVIGPHTVEQLRQNVKFVESYHPLADDEKESLAKLGRRLAENWGPRFGPAV